MDHAPSRDRVALVLHGGGGPQTVAPVVAHLASSFTVLAPTHPGWQGTPRPDDIDSVAALAALYLDRLAADGVRDVTVVGSSIGGWIALEMATQAAASARDAAAPVSAGAFATVPASASASASGSAPAPAAASGSAPASASAPDRYAGLIGAVIDIDGVGALIEGEPIVDFFALDARGLAEVAWHDPERGYLDPAGFTAEQRAIQQSNGQTMAAVAGRGMNDPSLVGRLATIAVPTLVVYGESDRVVTPAYGRAVAAAIPGARFAEVPAAGHLPHLENPEATWAVLDPFLASLR